jgi:acetyl/propionyl-CoA carboxylase alpha subunit
VRWDGGIEAGSEIGLHYDPMLAKLIVWAANRDLAIERMHRALDELIIEGVETSRDFHLRLMEDGEFRRGEIEIQWLERRLDSLTSVKPPAETSRAAAIAAALLADRDRNRGGSPGQTQAAQAAPTAAWQKQGRLEGLR